MFLKSLSVGEGDMFYIRHSSKNFSIIDCCIGEENRDKIIEELKYNRRDDDIVRFVSTHPDEDHILGLKYLDKEFGLPNIYVVKNEAIKKDEESEDFKFYKKVRNESRTCGIEKDLRRKWLNIGDTERDCSGISFLDRKSVV